MKPNQKTEDQAQFDRKRLENGLAQLKKWIGSGIPVDFQDWDFIKAGSYRKVMEAANKQVSSQRPLLKNVLQSVNELSSFYVGKERKQS